MHREHLPRRCFQFADVLLAGATVHRPSHDEHSTRNARKRGHNQDAPDPDLTQRFAVTVGWGGGEENQRPRHRNQHDQCVHHAPDGIGRGAHGLVAPPLGRGFGGHRGTDGVHLDVIPGVGGNAVCNGSSCTCSMVPLPHDRAQHLDDRQYVQRQRHNELRNKPLLVPLVAVAVLGVHHHVERGVCRVAKHEQPCEGRDTWRTRGDHFVRHGRQKPQLQGRKTHGRWGVRESLCASVSVT